MSYCREFGVFCNSATSLGFCSLTACRRMNQISNGVIVFADLREKRMMDIGKDLQNAYDDGYKQKDSEIVRCKDCCYWEQATADSGRCNRALEITAYANDYCSYGERKANE